MGFHTHVYALDFRDRKTLYIALTAPLVGLTVCRLVRDATRLFESYRRLHYHPRCRTILESPRRHVQELSQIQRQTLAYPPNHLPGARDVESPYGSIRVYEWGPANGRRVLFIHGISTPSLALGDLARHLVERGCRVMLFDLFGRGYSDAPDPCRHAQDISLFASQILLVLASSPIAWTGETGRFAVVGYSLGGGIAASFTYYMPQLVASLTLIAPGGILRPHRMAQSGRWLYADILPNWLVEVIVRRRLSGTSGPEGSGVKPESSLNEDEITVMDPADVVRAEVPSEGSSETTSLANPLIVMAKAVEWQITAHAGFVRSFISSIQHAPITLQHEQWRTIARRQEEASKDSSRRSTNDSFAIRKTLLILAARDEVLVSSEIAADAIETMGEDNVEVVMMDADHSVAVTRAKECAEHILNHWEKGDMTVMAS